MMKSVKSKNVNLVTRRLYSMLTDGSTAESHAKPFKSIPGPRGPAGLGNLYNYLPLIGDYSWLELHKAGLKKYNKYGPIVRETIVPGQDIIWLYEPNDIAKLLNERDYPQRRSHLALEKYRKDRPHVYKSAGLLSTNGPDWWRLRSEFQKEISAPKHVRSFLSDVDRVTKEFIDYFTTGNVYDMLPMISRLNLELTCLLTFDERLDSFSTTEMATRSRSSRLMEAAEITNSSILPTDQGLQMWRLFETPTYKRLRKAQEYTESIALELISKRVRKTNSKNSLARTSLVEEYLKNPNLDLADIVGITADLLLAGIDTTSYTTAFALYHISKYSEVQNKLYEEAVKVLQNKNSSLTPEALHNEIPYTRAVLKEVFRLNPISIGVGRILNKDLILSNYFVPKNSVVVTQNMIACRLEKNFEEPLRFLPERWLKRNVHNPYLVLPFGHGMRSCIARRLAEQNILVLLLRMIRSFEIKWSGDTDDLDVHTLLINKPSKPIIIKMLERK
ncbi:cytochrome P450 302a1, mitochondrial [Teleopsis dalmanni]|uniref:cytochrome P450 302a1, mitochondrial n=1 Tax=Teleopsis dalmanni TaxID=139649 RepID=UPI0018CE1D85|nr:cytochrome P450 302a1, mitochondrial [Teleopsis dalmanni]